MDLGRLALILGIGILAYYLLQSKPTTPVPSQPASNLDTGSPPSSGQTSTPTTSPNLPPCLHCTGAAHGDICLCADGDCYPVGSPFNIFYACSYMVDAAHRPAPHLWIDSKAGTFKLAASHREFERWYYTDNSSMKLCFNQ